MRLPRQPLRSRAARAAILALSVLTLGADVLLLTQRDRQTEVSLDDAIGSYRARAATAPAPSAIAAPSGSAESPATVPRSAARNIGTSSNRPATGPGAFTKPAAGVYEYETEGSERISIAGASHTYPPETFAIVRHTRGCGWEIEYRLVEEHVDIIRYCARAGSSVVTGHWSWVSFFGQGETAEFTCDPPLVVARTGDRRGMNRTGRCHATNGDVIDSHITINGPTPVTIGGRTLRALHIVAVNEMRGRANGTARSEVWYEPLTGLPLKVIRDVDTDAEAGFGSTHYSEHVEMTLRSLKPQT